MKLITIYYRLLGMLALLSLLACEKYEPQFRFDENEKINAEGILAEYSVISGMDSLVIDPKVSSNMDGELEYLWGIYETYNQSRGELPVLDTIGRAKKLVYPINRTAKDWNLVLKVRNGRTGYAEYFTSTVRVETPYTRGWFVAKEVSQQTDMDFFMTPSSIVPSGEKVDDVYSLMNGKRLIGKPLMLTFFADYKFPTGGNFVNTRSLALLSEQDISIMTLSDLKTFRDFTTIFHGAAPRRALQMIGNDFLRYFLINDGQLHTIVGQGFSAGIFGGRKLLGSQDAKYKLSKYHLFPTVGMAYFYDELSGNFFATTDRTVYLNPVSVMMQPPVIPLQNRRMIYMGTKVNSSSGGGAPQGYAIMQDRDDPTQLSVHQVNPQGPTGLRITSAAVGATKKLHQASNYSLLIGDQNLLLFSVGNEVWSYNLTSHVETLQFSVPSDEEVTFIRHRKLTGSGLEAPYSYNYVMIGTHSAGQYKIRMFQKNALGNLNPQPDFTLEGKGSAIDALYVGPSVANNMTYAYTY